MDTHLKFEKLEKATFDNITLYCKRSKRLIRSVRLKVFSIILLVYLAVLATITSFVSMLMINNPMKQVTLLAITMIISLLTIASILWFYRHKYMEDEESCSTYKLGYTVGKLKRKYANNWFFGSLFTTIDGIRAKLEESVKYYDVFQNVTSCIYSMFVITLFKINDVKVSTMLEKFEKELDNDAPKEFIDLYYESKNEISEISDLYFGEELISDKDKVEKLCAMSQYAGTHVFILRIIQLFCHENKISEDNCNRIIGFKNGESPIHEKIYNFLYKEPIHESNLINNIRSNLS